MTTRRGFLQTAAAAGLAVSLGGGALALQRRSEPETKKGKLKILVLGGTGFLGPAIINYAKSRGHTVAMFNRGRTRPGMFKGEVENLYGNRDPKKNAVIKGDDGTEKTYEGIESLKDRSFDVVFDDSGYYPRIVKASAEMLSPNVGQYVFISSVSAYDNAAMKPGDNEDAKLAELEDPTVETMGAGYQNYGGLKVLCERAAEAACPGKTTIVRPGFIVGPDDPTGRFTYWPVRVDRGGEVLAPGQPSDSIQLIDVRDLGEWLVHLAENRTFGTFDALGPNQGELNMGKVLAACGKATKSKHTLTWVPTSFIEKEGLSPGGDFPIWVPSQGESAGFHNRNVSRAIKAGLKFRPIEQTCKDTLEWWKAIPEGGDRKKVGGISPEREAEVLEKWAKEGVSAKPEAEKK
jgi:2'-hydroxyisoflavone reductase